MEKVLERVEMVLLMWVKRGLGGERLMGERVEKMGEVGGMLDG